VEDELGIHVALERQAQLTVVAADQIDAGDVRQPVGGAAFELKLDLSPLRPAA